MSVNDTKALTIGTLLGKIYTCPVCDAEYYDRRKPCPVCGYLHKPQKMGPRGENDDEPFTASLGDAVLSSVFENAFAAWHGDANGWSTTLGDAGTLLIIAPKEDSYYRLLHIPKNNYERVIVLQQNEDVASLMLDAEREVKARAEKLGDRNAPWRERPASPGQLKWLQSLRMPSHTGLTCGEASSLITHGEALKRIQGMKFTTHERVGA